MDPVRHAAPAVPGLALAGANRPATPGGEDGFLTAEEISALDLRGVEWAVLSACATGAADPDAAEAVQGLHRALRRAGVATVVLSLWFVDDAATASWMDALYRARLEQGLGTARAVRAAQRSVLSARRRAGETTHPFYWAAFVASGRPR
jgi:CHAT domain-containing protein